MASNHSENASQDKKRRSDRISMRIPISVIGTDLSGKDFTETAVTEKVARYGGSIVTKLALGPEQELTLARADGVESKARVIGQISIGADGNVYGVELLDPKANFWGIHFPAPDESSVAKVLLECGVCGYREIVLLNELEFDVFQANDRLQRVCPKCREFSVWKLASHEAPASRVQHLHPERRGQSSEPERNSNVTVVAEAIVPVPRPNRRFHPRVKVALKACILHDGEQDVVEVLNVSRGGILIRSKRQYPVDCWIQMAMPYTDNGANIFVPARIARRIKSEAGHQYGIKYLKR